MTAKILVEGPDEWAFRLELTEGKTLRMGRGAACDIPIPDILASGQHAELEYKNGWVVRDLGSTNGTTLNGVKVKEEFLEDGDEIHIGDTRIRFLDDVEMVPDEAWGQMVVEFASHHQQIRSALADADGLPDNQIYAATTAANMGTLVPPPTMQTSEAETRHGLNPEDARWVNEQVAMVLSILSRSNGKNLSALYTSVLERLRDAIGAQNGFLMVPSGLEGNIMRAFVGDKVDWMQTKPNYPIPLTIANEAFRNRRLVSNAMGLPETFPRSSASMVQMEVRSYIAVPLIGAQKRNGLLYFDIRNDDTRFEQKHVRLLEIAGGYLLQLDGAVDRVAKGG